MASETKRRSRSLWKISGEVQRTDITVPIHLAYCGVVAALRYQVKRKTSHLVVLAVDSPDALDSYVDAGRIFLRQFSDNDGYRDPFIRAIKRGKRDRVTEQEVFRRAAGQGNGILFCAGLDDVDEELRLFADLVATIAKPTAHQINATFRRFGHVLTKAEQEMVGSETWKRLVYAFQPDRPVSAGLRRLREVGQRVPSGNVTQPSEGRALADLHGLGKAGEWGVELARDLDDYKKGMIRWDEVDSGLLVSGPPGTGKTLFAEALANTCRVPIIAASAAQWQASGYLNDLLKAMKSTFEEAQSQAPCVLFIDEMDSFGSRAIMDSQHADYKRQVINGLLEHLDGFQRRTGVVVVGATNHPENLDPAITRPGRLDRHIEIPLPDAATRRLIFEQYSGITVPSSDERVFDRSTEGMSGASIERLVRDAKRTARRLGQGLQINHVIAAARPMARVTPEHLRLAAVHETGHAIVGLKLGLLLEGIAISDTVVTDGTATLGGARFEYPVFIKKTKSHYINQIAMLMAGIAAETLVFGEFTDGGSIGRQSDLARATALATQIEACLGFGESFAVEIVDEREMDRLRLMNPSLRSVVQNRLREAFENATAILTTNREAVVAISDALQREHYLSGKDVEDILNYRRADADHSRLPDGPGPQGLS